MWRTGPLTAKTIASLTARREPEQTTASLTWLPRDARFLESFVVSSWEQHLRQPEMLASQLQMIYDGGERAAKMDRNPEIAAPARAAATALIGAALAS
jgi:hypothetical protein